MQYRISTCPSGNWQRGTRTMGRHVHAPPLELHGREPHHSKARSAADRISEPVEMRYVHVPNACASCSPAPRRADHGTWPPYASLDRHYTCCHHLCPLTILALLPDPAHLLLSWGSRRMHVARYIENPCFWPNVHDIMITQRSMAKPPQRRVARQQVQYSVMPCILQGQY